MPKPANTPRLIGIAGRARAGKSTIAEHLHVQHGYRIINFADPLKDAIEAMGVDPYWLRIDKESAIPGLGVAGRQLLQTLGTEWGRQMIHPDLWLWLAGQRIVKAHEQAHARNIPIVIADVRFPNEAAWVRERGQLWHVTRPDTTPVRSHSSEAGITPLPGEPEFVNDRTRADLLTRVDAWLADHD